MAEFAAKSFSLPAVGSDMWKTFLWLFLNLSAHYKQDLLKMQAHIMQGPILTTSNILRKNESIPDVL